MLIIREAQRAALTEPFWQRFAPRMVDHLREYFPVDAALLGDEGLRAVVGHGIGRARAHGITVEGDACRYIDLAMALGSDFDTDPLLPWAAEILARAGGAAGRVGALRNRAMEHIEAVAGSDGGLALRAARRVHLARYEELCDPRVAADPAAERELLTDIHPTRCAALEEACSWEVFFAHRDRLAVRIGMDAPGPRALCAVWLCLLGGHFATDPQHPWLRPALDAARSTAPDATARATLRDGKA